MKYLLLIYANEAVLPKTPETQKAASKAWYGLAEEMKAAGVYQTSAGLSSIDNATTVRVRQRQTLITDGPFAETHEQLGGFFLLECKDLDEALRWAEKIPAAKFGSVEVRPVWSEGLSS